MAWEASNRRTALARISATPFWRGGKVVMVSMPMQSTLVLGRGHIWRRILAIYVSLTGERGL
jgi:hypothetical protein